MEKLNQLVAEKDRKLNQVRFLKSYIADITTRPLNLDTFDEDTWNLVIEEATVQRDGTITFKFRCNIVITK